MYPAGGCSERCTSRVTYKACYHSNSNSVSWEIYSWAAIEAHQAIFIPSEFALCAKYSHIVDFLGSRWMETAPTSIEVLLRPTLGQSDEPSDLRGSLSPTSVYSTWQSPGGHPSNYEPGATSPNFSDRANHDERTPYSVYACCLYVYNSNVQRQTAVTAYFSSKQLLLFVFARQYKMTSIAVGSDWGIHLFLMSHNLNGPSHS